MQYKQITVDVGATTKSHQVLWTNTDDFKSVIIRLGDFHAMCELFPVIGIFFSGVSVVCQCLCTACGNKGTISAERYNPTYMFRKVYQKQLTESL